MRKEKRIFYHKPVCAFLIGLTACSSCTPALPLSDPEKAVYQSTLEAQSAATQAQSFADDSIAQLELSKRLLKEARGLLKEAKEIESRVASAVKKIPKRRRVVCKAAQKKKVETKPEKKKDNEIGVLYSPSDAP